jgi:hypothetical protein
MSTASNIEVNIPDTGKNAGVNKPDLPACLFWEYDYETINWQKGAIIVIERVLDRGNVRELEEMICFYGRKKVLRVLKHKPIFLMDHSIERACAYFKLKPEDLVCYHRKKSRPGHWL